MTKRDIQAEPPTLTEMFAELPAEVKQQRLAELGSAILMSFDAISDAGVHSEVKGDDALNAYIRTYERMKAELADLRKRHGDNLKFIDTPVADKAVNQSAKQELAKVFGDLTITELAQKAIEAKGFLDQELTDWAATDTYCRAKAAEVLPEFEVYGDKDGVPPIEAVVDKLVERITTITAENESLRKGAPLGPIIGAQTIVEQELELKKLRKQVQHSLANNLCPDHRDKQQGKPCLACEIERVTAERDTALRHLSPKMEED